MTDQALLLHLGQRAELFCDGLVTAAFGRQPQVDDVERFHAEVLEILPDLGPEVPWLE